MAKTKDSQENIDKVAFTTDDIIDPNWTIVSAFEELQIVNETLKETRSEIKEKYNDDDTMLQLNHEIEEFKAKMKPKQELLKTKKEEFKVNNGKLFEQELSLNNKKQRLLYKITVAVAKKQELKDSSPVIIGEGRKSKRLVINLKPEFKKEKIDL